MARLNVPVATDLSESSRESTEIELDPDGDDGSFAWVAMNADALYKQYPDQWILVDKGQLIASAPTPEPLMQLARTRGIQTPFITKTTPPELPGRAVYGEQVV
jgi:hypothetical protein